MKVCMLTTIDNPFNPFTQFDDWNKFDEQHGYYTNGYLARIAHTSDELSDADYTAEIERAIDEICEYNVLGIYRKVYEDSFDGLNGQGKPLEDSVYEDDD